MSRLTAVIFLLAGTLTAHATVYVVDNGSGEIIKYSAANAGTVPDTGLSKPDAVTLDVSGNL